MEKNNENNRFQYTYSAKEQEELRRIREKYTEEKGEREDKVARLRRLDNRVMQKAQAVSLIFGVIGALVLGFGMSLIMTELSEILGSHKDMAMLYGILIGIVGGVLASFAYPMYNFVIKRERKKIAPEILRLTDELMK